MPRSSRGQTAAAPTTIESIVFSLSCRSPEESAHGPAEDRLDHLARRLPQPGEESLQDSHDDRSSKTRTRAAIVIAPERLSGDGGWERVTRSAAGRRDRRSAEVVPLTHPLPRERGERGSRRWIRVRGRRHWDRGAGIPLRGSSPGPATPSGNLPNDRGKDRRFTAVRGALPIARLRCSPDEQASNRVISSRNQKALARVAPLRRPDSCSRNETGSADSIQESFLMSTEHAVSESPGSRVDRPVSARRLRLEPMLEQSPRRRLPVRRRRTHHVFQLPRGRAVGA